jgi:hypothetical protein
MDRRGFLKLFSAGVAGIALQQAIPLGRVWSFPKKIVIALPSTSFLTTDWISMECLRILKRQPDDATPDLVLTAAFLPDSSHTPS